jgi:SAM-dependent methyltransferase
MALTDPGAFMPLGALIAGQNAGSKVMRNLGSLAYWDQTTEDRLAMARAVSPDPYSDDLVAAYRGALAADPVGEKILEGGRFLELGCGVAGRILLTLRAAPELTAVGIELSEDLAAEAARRAEDLGLADRFTVVCCDAGAYLADEPFDFGFWSQFFFPDTARGPALAVMLASLRPGASFQAPVGADPDATRNIPDAALEEAWMHTMLRSWGVPERTVEGLTEEIAGAGFVDLEVIARDAGPAVRAWRP